MQIKCLVANGRSSLGTRICADGPEVVVRAAVECDDGVAIDIDGEFLFARGWAPPVRPIRSRLAGGECEGGDAVVGGGATELGQILA